MTDEEEKGKERKKKKEVKEGRGIVRGTVKRLRRVRDRSKKT